jgi:hypothetical protein
MPWLATHCPNSAGPSDTRPTPRRVIVSPISHRPKSASLSGRNGTLASTHTRRFTSIARGVSFQACGADSKLPDKVSSGTAAAVRTPCPRPACSAGPASSRARRRRFTGRKAGSRDKVLARRRSAQGSYKGRCRAFASSPLLAPGRGEVPTQVALRAFIHQDARDFPAQCRLVKVIQFFP